MQHRRKRVGWSHLPQSNHQDHRSQTCASMTLLIVLDTPSNMTSLLIAKLLQGCAALHRDANRLQCRHWGSELQCRGAMPQEARLHYDSAGPPTDNLPPAVTATALHTAAADPAAVVKTAALIPALPPYLLLRPAPVDSKHDVRATMKQELARQVLSFISCSAPDIAAGPCTSDNLLLLHFNPTMVLLLPAVSVITHHDA